jgi:hypothetical protein
MGERDGRVTKQAGEDSGQRSGTETLRWKRAPPTRRVAIATAAQGTVSEKHKGRLRDGGEPWSAGGGAALSESGQPRLTDPRCKRSLPRRVRDGGYGCHPGTRWTVGTLYWARYVGVKNSMGNTECESLPKVGVSPGMWAQWSTAPLPARVAWNGPRVTGPMAWRGPMKVK